MSQASQRQSQSGKEGEVGDNNTIENNEPDINSSAQKQQRQQQHHHQQRLKESKKKRTKQKGQRHGARNQHRHKLFVRWLIKTFPNAIQKANIKKQEEENGSTTTATTPWHVLDVAGGKGELSARLTVCHATRVVMVDPRPANVVECFWKLVFRSLPKKWQQNILRLDDDDDQQQDQNDSNKDDSAGKNNETSNEQNKDADVEEKQQQNDNSPQSNKKKNDESLIKERKKKLAIIPEGNSGNGLEKIINHRFRQLVTCFPSDGTIDPNDTYSLLSKKHHAPPLQSHDDDDDEGNNTKNDNENDDDLLVPSKLNSKSEKDKIQLIKAVQNATLLIGMHADGATEAIVDVALHYRKPFVVVPCCVFPNFFTHRFVPVLTTCSNDDDNNNKNGDKNDGKSAVTMKPVRSHEDFCRYLALKDSHFIVETLPFEGRNIAIWWDGAHRDGDDDEV